MGTRLALSLISGLAALALIAFVNSTHPVFSAPSHAFEPGCPIPYASITQHRPIDDACNRFGESATYQPSSQAHRQTNAAKNNLCAVGPAIPLTIADFRALMQAAEDAGVPFGQGRLPPDRSVLRSVLIKDVGAILSVGEGSLVVFVGYVAGVSYAQRESVNCRRKGVQNYDIHVSLVAKKSDSRCKGIVAEMIPHFRPEGWTPSAIKATNRPVRVRGHLFFDAPHVPCRPDGTIPGGNSRRTSLWEIHPVYAFEVCRNTTIAACRVDRDQDWVVLSGSN